MAADIDPNGALAKTMRYVAEVRAEERSRAAAEDSRERNARLAAIGLLAGQAAGIGVLYIAAGWPLVMFGIGAWAGYWAARFQMGR